MWIENGKTDGSTELHGGDETATDGEHRLLVWWRGGSQWLENALTKSTG